MHTVVAVRHLPVPALVFEGAGLVVDANEAAAAMFATTAADLRGLSRDDLFPLEPRLGDRRAEAVARPGAVRLHASRRNGVPFSADAELSALSGGRVLAVLREIRGRRLLEESQRYLDVAFDSSPVGMALFNTDGRYERVNAALCAMLGRPADELIGRRDQELTHPDDRDTDLVAADRILRGEMHTFQTEKRFLRPDGAVVWTIANLVFLRDEGGRPLCWLGQFQDITEREAEGRRLRHLAEHDPLTGVANRRRALRELERRLSEAVRYGELGAVLVLDLDGFKAVNDAEGHAAGDRVLVAVADALCARLRTSDLLARLGGDEFAVVLPHCDVTAAVTVADQLLATVADAGGRRVTASCGIAGYDPLGPRRPEAVLAAADRAMYEAKRAGGNTVCVRQDAAERVAAG